MTFAAPACGFRASDVTIFYSAQIIEDSLRENLRRAPTPEGARARRFRMVAFGQRERRVAHESADFRIGCRSRGFAVVGPMNRLTDA
jgi:hypothetical protein